MNLKKLLIGTLTIIAMVLAYGLINTPSDASSKNKIVLTETNTLVLGDEVNVVTVSKILNKAMKLDNNSNEPIYLVLDTPGGDIQAGLEFIAGMKALKRPVHTITFFAASMGFQIVQGLGDRYILPFGTLMAHKASGGFKGEFPGQLDARYSYYIERINEMDRITVARTNGKIKDIKTFQAMYENEYWVDGFKAVTQGFADQVVNVKCDKTLDKTFAENINFFGANIKVTFSECPAIRGPVDVTVTKTNNLPNDLLEKEVERIKNKNNELRKRAKEL